MEYIIRQKELKDCEQAERVKTLSWNETYKGIVNDEFLEHLKLNEMKRIEKQKENYKNDNKKQFVLEVDGKVVGICTITKSRNENYPTAGELQALYIINDYKGYGYGRKLFYKAVEELEKMGYHDMIIGCLSASPTNGFYLHMKGKIVETSVVKLSNQELKENIYYFENLKRILEEGEIK